MHSLDFCQAVQRQKLVSEKIFLMGELAEFLSCAPVQLLDFMNSTTEGECEQELQSFV